MSKSKNEYPNLLNQLDSAKQLCRAKSDNTLTITNAESVIPNHHEIHPKDIKLIAALGDSLLTGLGVSKREEYLKNRVLSKLSILLSWSISGEHRQNNCITGGGEKVVSIARLMSCFTDLQMQMNRKKTMLGSRGDGFNLARTGSKSSQLVAQATRLLPKIKHVKGWKMIFIWIGANDIFSMSTKKIQEQFRRNLQNCIEIFRNHTSNAIVVLLPVPFLDHLCNPKKKDEIETRVSLINAIIKDLVVCYQTLVSDSFRIVFEPFPLESRVEMISSLDSIHPSIRANELICKAVWNNLFLEDCQKLTVFEDVVNSSWTEPGPLDFFKLG